MLAETQLSPSGTGPAAGIWHMLPPRAHGRAAAASPSLAAAEKLVGMPGVGLRRQDPHGAGDRPPQDAARPDWHRAILGTWRGPRRAPSQRGEQTH